MSKVFSFKSVQKIPAGIDDVWGYFSSPSNLADITPANMAFKVISKFDSNNVYAGQVIEYTLRPVLGIQVYWMTEITHVKDKVYFVDEQRFGPYSLWHHQHHFKVIEGGVEMTDIVHYKIPYWFIGDIANSLFVARQLKKIFSYRFQAIQKRFGPFN